MHNRFLPHSPASPPLSLLVAGLLVAGLLFIPQAHAQVFKCKTPDGNTVISTSPCPKEHTTVRVAEPEHIPPEVRAEAARRLEKMEAELKRLEASRTPPALATPATPTPPVTPSPTATAPGNRNTSGPKTAPELNKICSDIVLTLNRDISLTDEQKKRLKHNCLTQNTCLQAALPESGTIGLGGQQKETLLSCANMAEEGELPPGLMPPNPLHPDGSAPDTAQSWAPPSASDPRPTHLNDQ